MFAEHMREDKHTIVNINNLQPRAYIFSES